MTDDVDEIEEVEDKAGDVEKEPVDVVEVEAGGTQPTQAAEGEPLQK